jgi:hypothetical protein
MSASEALLAGLTLAVCVLLLVRLLIGARRRHQVDAALRRGWEALRHLPRRVATSRRLKRDATREAEDAIARARRREVDVDGNVLRPKHFERPRKPH